MPPHGPHSGRVPPIRRRLGPHRPEPAATAARLDDAAGPVQARALDALQARGAHPATVDALLALARRGGLRAEALPAATAFIERASLDTETAVLLADAILTNHTVPAAPRARPVRRPPSRAAPRASGS